MNHFEKWLVAQGIDAFERSNFDTRKVAEIAWDAAIDLCEKKPLTVVFDPKDIDPSHPFLFFRSDSKAVLCDD